MVKIYQAYSCAYIFRRSHWNTSGKQHHRLPAVDETKIPLGKYGTNIFCGWIGIP